MDDGVTTYEKIEPQFLFSQKHVGYINTLSIEQIDQDLLLCGGADSALTIWDLNAESSSADEDVPSVNKAIQTSPLCSVERKKAHEFGISKVSWWPFDSSLFLTGSYDGKVKVWDSEELEEAYSFSVDNKVYNFNINPLDCNGLVAVALENPLIRLLDLRAAGSAQTLKGHNSGSVCAVSWSPTHQWMLASGGTDGTVRLWDIRQANQQVALLDMLRTNENQSLTPLEFRRSHRAVCNGIVWHPNGTELLTIGLDNKARTWDLSDGKGGINKAVNFGPLFQNGRQQTLEPLLTPSGDDDLYVLLPSDTGDILVSQYTDGRLVRRLVPPRREIRTNRQACIASRGPEPYEFYSGTCDGSVIKWTVPEDEK